MKNLIQGLFGIINTLFFLAALVLVPAYISTFLMQIRESTWTNKLLVEANAVPAYVTLFDNPATTGGNCVAFFSPNKELVVHDSCVKTLVDRDMVEAVQAKVSEHASKEARVPALIGMFVVLIILVFAIGERVFFWLMSATKTDPYDLNVVRAVVFFHAAGFVLAAVLGVMAHHYWATDPNKPFIQEFVAVPGQEDTETVWIRNGFLAPNGCVFDKARIPRKIVRKNMDLVRESMFFDSNEYCGHTAAYEALKKGA